MCLCKSYFNMDLLNLWSWENQKPQNFNFIVYKRHGIILIFSRPRIKSRSVIHNQDGFEIQFSHDKWELNRRSGLFAVCLWKMKLLWKLQNSRQILSSIINTVLYLYSPISGISYDPQKNIYRLSIKYPAI